MPDAATMESAVRAYVEAYGRGDLDGIVALFAEDAVVEDPVGTPPRIGRAAIREFFAVGVALGARLMLDGPIRVVGDCAVFPFHVRLNWEGQPTRIDVIDLFRFNPDGRIAEMRAYFGPTNMSAQPQGE